MARQIRAGTVACSPFTRLCTFAADIPVLAIGEFAGQVKNFNGVNAHSPCGSLVTARMRLFGAKVSAVITFISACISNSAVNAGNQNAWRVFS